MRLSQKLWALRNPSYRQEWRARNKDRINKARKVVRNLAAERLAAERARHKKLAYIRERKVRPCMDCHQSYPFYVMHFDHREPATKFKSLSQMSTYSYARINAEIEKCDLVCANCHAGRTYRGIETGQIKVFGRYYGSVS